MRKNQGLITPPFMMAFVIVTFLIQSFFNLALSLIYASLLQYVTYASARKMSLGGADASSQIRVAGEKYQSLSEKILKTSSSSFQVEGPTLGFNETYEGRHYRSLFYGSFVKFVSPILTFEIPFLVEDQGDDLQTSIGSYLGREPSQRECEAFKEKRTERFCRIFQAEGYNVANCVSSQGEDEDNGC